MPQNEEIGDTKHFSVVAGEASHVSKIEQMHLAICFVKETI